MSTAVNGLGNTGTADRNMLEESDFLPRSTTDIYQIPRVEETEEHMPKDPQMLQSNHSMGIKQLYPDVKHLQSHQKNKWSLLLTFKLSTLKSLQ